MIIQNTNKKSTILCVYAEYVTFQTNMGPRNLVFRQTVGATQEMNERASIGPLHGFLLFCRGIFATALALHSSPRPYTLPIVLRHLPTLATQIQLTVSFANTLDPRGSKGHRLVLLIVL